MVVTDGKVDDVGEGDEDPDGNDWSGHGNDDNDDEAKDVPVLALGTRLPRLQGNSANRWQMNTPGKQNIFWNTSVNTVSGVATSPERFCPYINIPELPISVTYFSDWVGPLTGNRCKPGGFLFSDIYISVTENKEPPKISR